MKKFFIITLAVVMLAVLGGSYFYFKTAQDTAEPAAQSPQASQPADRVVDAPTEHRTPPPGQQEYYDNEYHFSLLVPATLQVNKRGEGSGTATVVFENENMTQGFQIYIIPYTGPQVSQEEFQKDVPSGVRNNMHTGTLAGASAMSFESTDARLGTIYEIWILGHGYLYEATALKSQSAWLESVVQTWQFLSS